MEDDDDARFFGEAVTTDRLTKQYIDRLRDAWQQCQDDLEIQLNLVDSCEQRIEQMSNELLIRDAARAVQERMLQLSELFAAQSDNPFALLSEAARDLPTISAQPNGSLYDLGPEFTHGLLLVCLVKVGDNWAAICSDAKFDEAFLFKSPRLDNFIKYKISTSGEAQSAGVIESLSNVLPAQLIDFISAGGLATLDAEIVVRDDQEAEELKQEEYREAIFYRNTQLDGHRSLFVLVPCGDEDLSRASSFHSASLEKLLNLLLVPPSLDSPAGRDVVMLKKSLEHVLPFVMSSLLRMFEQNSNKARSLRSKVMGSIQNALSQDGKSGTIGWKAAADAIAATVDAFLAPMLSDGGGDRAGCTTSTTCDLLVAASWNAVESVMLTSSMEALHLSSCETERGEPSLLHGSFEEAMSAAVLGALDRGRAHLESYSKVTPLVPAAREGRRGARQRMAYEHRIFLAVPMPSDAVRAAILVQLIYREAFDNDSSPHDTSMHAQILRNRQRPFQAGMINAISSALSTEVPQALLAHLATTNYRNLCVFGNRAAPSAGCSGEIPVIEGAAAVMSDFAHSTASTPEAALRGLVDGLRKHLHSDWAAVLLLPAAVDLERVGSTLVVDDCGCEAWRPVAQLPVALRRAVLDLAAPAPVSQRADMCLGVKETSEFLQVPDSLLPGLHAFANCMEACHHVQVVRIACEAFQPVVIVCAGRLFRGAFKPEGSVGVARMVQLAAKLHRSSLSAVQMRALETSTAVEMEIEAEARAVRASLAEVSATFEAQFSSSPVLHHVLAHRRSAFTTIAESLRKIIAALDDSMQLGDFSISFVLKQSGEVSFALNSQQAYTPHLDEPSAAAEDVGLFEQIDHVQRLDGEPVQRRVELVARVRYARTEADVLTSFAASSPAVAHWVTFVSNHLQQHCASLVHCPAGTAMSEGQDEDLDELVLRILAQAMLNSAPPESITSSLTRPYYHLHDYLHSQTLLHSLQDYSPLSDFVVLPITSFPVKTALSDAHKETEQVFKHLLNLGNSEEGREIVVNLPTKLSQILHIVHRAVERRHFDPALVEASAGPLLLPPGESKRRGGYLELVHQQFEESVLKSVGYSRRPQSVLCELQDVNSVLWNYFYELDDHLEGNLCEYLLGKRLFDGLGGHTYRPAEGRLKSSALDYVLDGAQSKVFIYSPLYPSNIDQPDNRSQLTLLHPWTTHYLLVSKKDRLVPAYQMQALQAQLDRVFHASQIVAAGQPWFECVKGIEQLLSNISRPVRPSLPPRLAADPAVSSSHDAFLDEHLSADRCHNAETVFQQGCGILNESAKIFKLSLGDDLFLGASTYFLSPFGSSHRRLVDAKGVEFAQFVHTDTPELTAGPGGRPATEGEELGLPETDEAIALPVDGEGLQRALKAFYKHLATSQHAAAGHHLVHFEHRVTSGSVVKDHSIPVSCDGLSTVHYLETSARQFYEQMAHFDKVTGVKGRAPRLVRDDVRVLQIIVCAASEREDGNGPTDRVVACMALYMRAPDDRGRAIAATKGPGLWANLQRVMDIAGGLLGSIYAQSQRREEMRDLLCSRIEALGHENRRLVAAAAAVGQVVEGQAELSQLDGVLAADFSDAGASKSELALQGLVRAVQGHVQWAHACEAQLKELRTKHEALEHEHTEVCTEKARNSCAMVTLMDRAISLLRVSPDAGNGPMEEQDPAVVTRALEQAHASMGVFLDLIVSRQLHGELLAHLEQLLVGVLDLRQPSSPWHSLVQELDEAALDVSLLLCPAGVCDREGVRNAEALEKCLQTQTVVQTLGVVYVPVCSLKAAPDAALSSAVLQVTVKGLFPSMTLPAWVWDGDAHPTVRFCAAVLQKMLHAQAQALDEESSLGDVLTCTLLPGAHDEASETAQIWRRAGQLLGHELGGYGHCPAFDPRVRFDPGHLPALLHPLLSQLPTRALDHLRNHTRLQSALAHMHAYLTQLHETYAPSKEAEVMCLEIVDPDGDARKHFLFLCAMPGVPFLLLGLVHRRPVAADYVAIYNTASVVQTMHWVHVQRQEMASLSVELANKTLGLQRQEDLQRARASLAALPAPPRLLALLLPGQATLPCSEALDAIVREYNLGLAALVRGVQALAEGGQVKVVYARVLPSTAPLATELAVESYSRLLAAEPQLQAEDLVSMAASCSAIVTQGAAAAMSLVHLSTALFPPSGAAVLPCLRIDFASEVRLQEWAGKGVDEGFRALLAQTRGAVTTHLLGVRATQAHVQELLAGEMVRELDGLVKAVGDIQALVTKVLGLVTQGYRAQPVEDLAFVAQLCSRPALQRALLFQVSTLSEGPVAAAGTRLRVEGVSICEDGAWACPILVPEHCLRSLGSALSLGERTLLNHLIGHNLPLPGPKCDEQPPVLEQTVGDLALAVFGQPGDPRRWVRVGLIGEELELTLSSDARLEVLGEVLGPALQSSALGAACLQASRAVAALRDGLGAFVEAFVDMLASSLSDLMATASQRAVCTEVLELLYVYEGKGLEGLAQRFMEAVRAAPGVRSAEISVETEGKEVCRADTPLSPLTPHTPHRGQATPSAFTFSPRPFSPAMTAHTRFTAQTKHVPSAQARLLPGDGSDNEHVEVVASCGEVRAVLTLAMTARPLPAELELWETLIRAFVRRAFELHRGRKAKDRLFAQSQELVRQSSELAEQSERVMSLEQLQALTRQDLEGMVAEQHTGRLQAQRDQRKIEATAQKEREEKAQLAAQVRDLRSDHLRRQRQWDKDREDHLRRIAALSQEVGRLVLNPALGADARGVQRKVQALEDEVRTPRPVLSPKRTSNPKGLAVSVDATEN